MCAPICRFALPLAPLAPLVDAVLRALQAALPAEAAAAVARAYFHSAAAAGDGGECAWGVLCAALLRWAGVRDAPAPSAPPGAAWEALLRSETHARGAARAQLQALGALPQPALLPLAAAEPAPAAAPPPRAEARAALDALHAVYEDHKLDMLKARTHACGRCSCVARCCI
jgi:hypothetical protein